MLCCLIQENLRERYKHNHPMAFRRILLGSGALLAATTAYAAATAFSPSPPASAEIVERDGGRSLRLQDGRLLEYFVHGDATTFKHTILALPGANTTGKLFEILSEKAKAEHVRIISPSLPGFGCSDFKPKYTILEWTEDAGALLDHLHVSQCHVLGTSLGSILAAGLSSTAAHRVRNTMLYVAFAPETADNDPLQGSMLDMFGKMRDKPLLKRTLEKLFFMPMLRSLVPKTSDVYRAISRQWEGASYCADLIYQPWQFEWKSMARGRNVFIVSGKQDTCAPPHNQLMLAREITGSQLIEYDGAHEYPLEHPELMWSHVRLLLL